MYDASYCLPGQGLCPAHRTAKADRGQAPSRDRPGASSAGCYPGLHEASSHTAAANTVEFLRWIGSDIGNDAVSVGAETRAARRADPRRPCERVVRRTRPGDGSRRRHARGLSNATLRSNVASASLPSVTARHAPPRSGSRDDGSPGARVRRGAVRRECCAPQPCEPAETNRVANHVRTVRRTLSGRERTRLAPLLSTSWRRYASCDEARQPR